MYYDSYVCMLLQWGTMWHHTGKPVGVLVSVEGFACGHFLLVTCTCTTLGGVQVYVMTGILSPVVQ